MPQGFSTALCRGITCVTDEITNQVLHTGLRPISIPVSQVCCYPPRRRGKKCLLDDCPQASLTAYRKCPNSTPRPNGRGLISRGADEPRNGDSCAARRLIRSAIPSTALRLWLQSSAATRLDGLRLGSVVHHVCTWLPC